MKKRTKGFILLAVVEGFMILTGFIIAQMLRASGYTGGFFQALALVPPIAVGLEIFGAGAVVLLGLEWLFSEE